MNSDADNNENKEDNENGEIADKKEPKKVKSVEGGSLGSGIILRNYFVNEMASACKYAIPSIKHLVKWIPWNDEPLKEVIDPHVNVDDLWGMDHNFFEGNEDDAEDLNFLKSEKPVFYKEGGDEEEEKKPKSPV